MNNNPQLGSRLFKFNLFFMFVCLHQYLNMIQSTLYFLLENCESLEIRFWGWTLNICAKMILFFGFGFKSDDADVLDVTHLTTSGEKLWLIQYSLFLLKILCRIDSTWIKNNWCILLRLHWCSALSDFWESLIILNCIVAEVENPRTV